MRVNDIDCLHVSLGGPKPIIFKYLVYADITKEVLAWLDEQYATTGGYGKRYYYQSGRVWFRSAKQESWFLLKFPQ